MPSLRVSCSVPFERCAFRWSIWPSCSPRGGRRDRARAVGAGGHARAHAQHHSGAAAGDSIAASVGMTDQSMREMYRLMAIAKYEERYVIPKATSSRPMSWRSSAARSTSTVAVRARTVRRGQWPPSPVAVETFHALRQRQTSDVSVSGDELQGRVNLLNWDGKGTPEGCSQTEGASVKAGAERRRGWFARPRLSASAIRSGMSSRPLVCCAPLCRELAASGRGLSRCWRLGFLRFDRDPDPLRRCL